MGGNAEGAEGAWSPMDMLNMAGGIGIATSVIGGAVGFFMGQSAKKDAEKQARAAKAKLNSILDSRQSVINPYENTKDLSSLAKDLSGQLKNPYANLGVATQAAEIQMEQTDMALANTLDTIRATGASAGGATALAQAALQSKKGVSASIEQQEAQNEKLKAQGEQQLQQQKMAEQQRIQSVAQGQMFEFNAQEKRTDQEIGMAQAEMQMAQQAAAAADASMGAAIGGALGGIGSVAGAYMGGVATLGKPTV
jgi:hypothetical protein